jgi:hypothetical protein
MSKQKKTREEKRRRDARVERRDQHRLQQRGVVRPHVERPVRGAARVVERSDAEAREVRPVLPRRVAHAFEVGD